jgi:sugar phosphate isomerase/epimerase
VGVKRIGLHVHSFSLRYHLRHRDVTGYDVFAYIEEMARLGFTGVNVSANGAGLRDLGGTTPEHFRAVASAAASHGMRLELDTSDTRVEHMTTMLHVAAACGADTLRTYTKYDAPLGEVITWTVRDLREIAPLAEALGVMVVLENHEDFTGPVLAGILAAVGHPSVRALYDYGNSQMVGEDPLLALAAMAPFVARVHAKDHVLVWGPDGPVVQGVPFGSGRLPTLEITDALFDAGVRRFCFENVWGYRAPMRCRVEDLPDTPCFAWAEPTRYLDADALTPAQAVVGERASFDEGLAALHRMLADGGYEVASEPVS